MSYKIIKQYAREMRKKPTKAEEQFWSLVRNKKFHGHKFYRQYILKAPTGNSFYIADFCCFSSKLVVEVDGEIHRFQKTEDELRTQELEGMGFKVIRFSNEEVLYSWESVKKTLQKNL